jgi:hypothetical protein
VRNIHLKVLALIFALLLWLLATNKEITQSRLSLKLLPKAQESSYRLSDYSPKKVELVVEGPRAEIGKLRESGKVEVELPPTIEKTRHGWVEVELRRESFAISPSLKVREVEPKKIRVKVEKLLKKAVPIRLNLRGVPPNAIVELHPNYATISIPEELASLPLTVQSEVVEVGEVRLPAEIVVPLDSKLPVEPKSVKVIIRRKDEGKEKTLRD